MNKLNDTTKNAIQALYAYNIFSQYIIMASNATMVADNAMMNLVPVAVI